MKLYLNVYDEKNEVKKTCEAQTVDLEFGTVRSLMKVLNVDKMNDSTELLSSVYGAWEQVTGVLNRCFPDMEPEDWEHVKVKELLPVVLNILKASFTEILSIPKDPKNYRAGTITPRFLRCSLTSTISYAKNSRH